MWCHFQNNRLNHIFLTQFWAGVFFTYQNFASNLIFHELRSISRRKKMKFLCRLKFPKFHFLKTHIFKHTFLTLQWSTFHTMRPLFALVFWCFWYFSSFSIWNTRVWFKKFNLKSHIIMLSYRRYDIGLLKDKQWDYVKILFHYFFVIN